MEYLSLSGIVVIILVICYLILNRSMMIAGLTLVLILGLFFGMKYSLETSGTLAIFVALVVSLIMSNKMEQFSVKSEDTKEEEVTQEVQKVQEVESEEMEEEEEEDSEIDLSSTFLDAYKALTPDQINSMTKDARELLNTQKSLMSTMKEMTPIVEEGRKMLSQFGGYFGNKSIGSLAETAKSLNQKAS